jgi:hypothetical protein
MTVLAPVGGLRLAGYIAVTVDPLPALGAIDRALSMAVTVTRLDSPEVLHDPQGVATPAGPSAVPARLIVRGMDGAPLAAAETVADLSALDARLGGIRADALLLFLAVSGLAASGATLVVWLAIRRARRATEDAAAALAEREAEARRLEAERAELAHKADREAAERAPRRPSASPRRCRPACRGPCAASRRRPPPCAARRMRWRPSHRARAASPAASRAAARPLRWRPTRWPRNAAP